MRNYKLFYKFIALLTFLIILFSFMFEGLMLSLEGKSYTFTSSVYWVLTTMTTLGFGDIVFNTDFGRVFTLVVLVFGISLIFIGLPYMFISFVMGPWIEEAIKNRIPRKVPKNMKGHVIICGDDPIALTLIEKLKEEGTPYYIVVHDIHKAETLFDDKLSVFFGSVFDEETYRRLNISTAKLVFANQDAVTNSHIALVVRQVSDIPIVALIEDEGSRLVLKKAGCTYVLPVKHILGKSVSNRTMSGSLKTSTVGNFDQFEIANIPVYATPFQNKKIDDLMITENTNVKIVGVWERTNFKPPEPNTVLTKSSILVLMGEKEELFELNSCLSIYHPINIPIIIIGGGAVGLAVAQDLDKKNVPYILVDKNDIDIDVELKNGSFLKGDPLETSVLEEAGISSAPSVAITTNNDEINNYLTIYCRMLNKEICIISRANYEKNLNSLYKAGADFVVPYNMLGSNMVYNIIHQRNLILRTEGLSIFEYKISKKLAKKTVLKSKIRKYTQCNIICIKRNKETIYEIKKSTILNLNDILCVIGTTEQEHKFFKIFGDGKYRKIK